MLTELGQGSGIEVDDKGREVVGSSAGGEDEGIIEGATDDTALG